MSRYHINLNGSAVANGAAVPLYKWENGRRTEEPTTNADGIPMYRQEIMFMADGEEAYSPMTVEFASATVPQPIPAFTPVKLQDPVLTVAMWTDNVGKSHLSEKIRVAGIKKA